MSKRRSSTRSQQPSEPPCRARFLIDEDVPFGVTRFLDDRGHDVRTVLDSLGAGMSDDTVARYAAVIDATVVTCNVKDFKKLIGRRRRSDDQELRKVGALYVHKGDHCTTTRVVRRFEQTIDLVEYEISRMSSLKDKRMFAEIHDDQRITFHR